MKPCPSIGLLLRGTGGHFYRYGYGYGCSVRVLGTGTGVGYGCWVQVLGTGTGVGYCWVRLRELVLGILLLGAGTGVGYMFGCRHRTHVPYPCTVPMYRATVPMYGIHSTVPPYPSYPVPYPWTVPTVPTIRTQLAADLASDFLISLKFINNLLNKNIFFILKDRLLDRLLTGYV